MSAVIGAELLVKDRKLAEAIRRGYHEAIGLPPAEAVGRGKGPYLVFGWRSGLATRNHIERLCGRELDEGEVVSLSYADLIALGRVSRLAGEGRCDEFPPPLMTQVIFGGYDYGDADYAAEAGRNALFADVLEATDGAEGEEYLYSWFRWS